MLSTANILVGRSGKCSKLFKILSCSITLNALNYFGYKRRDNTT